MNTTQSTTTTTYDANGSQTTRVVNGVTYTLTYDAENRLIQVKQNGTTIASLVYNGDGQRVKSVIGSTTTAFVGNYLEWTGSTGTMKRSFYAGRDRLAVKTGTALNWLFGDHLGSTSVATNYNGSTVVSSMLYKPFGEVRYSSGTLPTKYTFTGQYSNVNDFGLMYYNARFYDPYLNRWVQPDSIIPDPSNPQDWNRYSYVRDNPLKYTDSTGHWVDVALDVAFILYDINDIKTNGLTWVSGLSLAADVVGALLPVVTGAGLAVRAVSHADDVVKVVNTTDNVIDAVEIANRADDITDVVSHGDDLADALSHVDDLPDSTLVCRGGACGADNFANGSGITINPDGTLSGVSVNSAPGASFEDLTTTIPNRQVGVTTVGDVLAAGGNVVGSPTVNNPYHSILSGITPFQAERLFTPTRLNPHRLLPK